MMTSQGNGYGTQSIVVIIIRCVVGMVKQLLAKNNEGPATL